ncbi:putative erythromycin esterase [Bacillus sp. 1NLA3E]|nr:putative erythromycin esterase [Bacillus sp. 1NLA3E]
MVEVINKIDQFYENKAKGIIWEHNTHVGDARATDMADEGMVNVGQILGEQQGQDQLFIIGFGTHRGTVIAADQWGVDFKQMITPPAQTGSWKDLLYNSGPHDKFLIFNDENKHIFNHVIGHRAIGVVYNPKHEQYGNYVPSVISQRYDAFIYINHSNALKPIQMEKVFL